MTISSDFPKCTGEFNGQDEKCTINCDIAAECYKRNNPRVKL